MPKRPRHPTRRFRPGSYQCIIRNIDPETESPHANFEKITNKLLTQFTEFTIKRTTWHAIYRHSYRPDPEDAEGNGGSEGSNACAEGEHLHIVYQHYRGAGEELGRFLGSFAERYGCRFKFSRLRKPGAYWKYLRQGKGRELLYEKNKPDGGEQKQTKLLLNSGREEEHGLQWGLTVSGASSDSQSSLGVEESDIELPSSERDLDFWDSKKEKLPWTFQLGVRRILEIFPALDVQEFKSYVLHKGTPEMQDWMQRMKFSNKFDLKVNDEIVEMRTANFFVPWIAILSNTTTETYESLCDRECLSVSNSICLIEQILEWNGINVSKFINHLFKWGDRLTGKKNSIHFVGEVNSGKTLLANSIIRSLVYYAVLNKVGQKVSDFVYEPLLGARVGLMNECIIADHNYEDMLNLTEGERLPISVKYKSQLAAKRVPLLFTSNEILWKDCSSWRMTQACRAFPERIMILTFKTFPELANYTNKDIHPRAWFYLFAQYVNYDVIKEHWPEYE